MRTLIIIVTAIASAAVASLALVFVVSMRADVSSLRQQVSTLQSGLSAAQQHEASDYTSLSGKLSGLTVPTDPMSAYNQVCNSNDTDEQTGVVQPYYYPCTNSVQTIPQPGG